MIPSDFVDDLLSRIDIVDVISDYVPLKKGGQNYVACCPFHKEKTPSFTVAPNKQFYHCFGCGAHGSAIGFLMEYAHLSFADAVEKLANRIGMRVPHTQNRETHQEREEKKRQRVSLVDYMVQCANFYHKQLALSTRAQDYLRNRGLNAEIVSRFSLGYAPAQWQALQNIFDDYPSKDLISSGMVLEKEGRYYDRFRDRIMFPIRDVTGQVVAFGGRILDSGEPKYLNSPETPIFNKGSHLYGLYEARADIRQEHKVVVVEGYMDVVALAQHNIGYAVATLGTATTSEHIRLLFRQTDTIYFCFDGDTAGRKSAWRALENSLSQLQDDKGIYFLFLPPEHDPDSYVREYGSEFFSGSLKKDSIPLSRYWLNELMRDIDTNTQEGRAELIHRATPHLSEIKAVNLKYLLTQNLAQTVGMDIADIQYLLGQQLPVKKHTYRKARFPNKTFRQPRLSTLAQQQIKWLLINPKWEKYVEMPEYLLLSEEYAILAELSALIRENNLSSTEQVWENLRNHEYEEVLHRIWCENAKISEEFGELDEDDEIMFRQGMQRLALTIRDEQVNELVAKSKYQSLTATEQELLKNLLIRN
ncbi:MAG: DNA primase [Neisseriaceae bacterium]|nr:DNA primase [Neisseriaceae bacterium]